MSTSADRFGWCRYLGADSGADASVALALDIFTPRNPPELRRTIRRHGTLLVVTPLASHLSEVQHAFGLINIDACKDSRLVHAFAPYFRCSEQSLLTWHMTINDRDVLSLAKMATSARHIDAHALSQRVTPIPITVTAAVALRLYRPI